MSSEYLSTHILETNFINVLAPLYFVQFAMGTTRLYIKDKFASLPTVGQKLYTVLWMLAVTASACYFGIRYHEIFYEKNWLLYAASSLGIIIQYISYMLNVIIVRFSDQSKYLNLYVVFQKIDRMLLLNKSEFGHIDNLQYYASFFFIYGVAIFYIVGFATHVSLTIGGISMLTVFIGAAIFSNYIEMLLMGALIWYVTTRLVIFNDVLKYRMSEGPEMYRSIGKIATERTLLISIAEARFTVENTNGRAYIVCLGLILLAFQLIASMFKLQMFIMVTGIFLWVFIVIEAMIEGVRTELYPVAAVVTIVLLILFYFGQVAVIAAACSSFHGSLRETKALCTELRAKCEDESVLRNVKLMKRFIEWESPELSVYGIFTVDTRLPLRLLGQIANNVIVVMQILKQNVI